MLINNSAVKKYTLEQLKELRPHMEFTQVSREFLAEVEASVRRYIENKIRMQPTKGKTVR